MLNPAVRVAHVCYGFCCHPWIRAAAWVVFINIFLDLAAFPFVHSFWNLVQFEGWFHHD